MIKLGKAAFHDPAFGQDNKARFPVEVPDDFDGPLAELRQGHAQFFTSITSIASQMPQPRKRVV